MIIVEAQFKILNTGKFFSLNVFYCGASEALNLCTVLYVEKSTSSFELKCANTFRE